MSWRKNLWLKRGIICLTLFLLFIGAEQSRAQPVMLVKDILPGGEPRPQIPFRELGSLNSTVFFAATDGTTGDELWKSDGTVGGTALLKEIGPGTQSGSQPRNWTNLNGELFFDAEDVNHGRELWKTDGTTAGTILVKDINPGPNSSMFMGALRPANIKGTLYFGADDGVSGIELWKSDGTEAGTVLVKDINPGPGDSVPGSFTELNGNVLFTAHDDINGQALWKTDGTTAGTVLVKDFFPGTTGLAVLVGEKLNGIVFVAADDGINGRELWKTDGTSAGTVLVKDIRPGPSGSINSFSTRVNVIFKNMYFFAADDGASGEELWQSDGTTAGTVMVKDINPGLFAASNPGSTFLSGTGGHAILNDVLLFSARSGNLGRELWQSDGTSSGTVLVKEIRPGELSSDPHFFTVVGDTLFFAADDGSVGEELWRSDGTTLGTALVKDINPGAPSSFASELANVNGTLFFNAFEPVAGQELWAATAPVMVTLTPINPPIQIPPGGGQFQYTVTLDNISGRTQTIQVWNQFILPDGSTFGPTIGPVTLDLPSGQSRSRTLTQEVPAGAPAGSYTHIFNVGTFPDTIDDSDSFPFTKLSSPSATPGIALQGTGEWQVRDSETGLPVSAWARDDFVLASKNDVIPQAFVLQQNYPNPFNPSTTIIYRLPEAARVRLTIHDLTGRQVRELVNQNQNAGSYSVQWDGRNQAGQTVATGVYIYEIQAGQFSQTRKMLFIN